MGSAQIQSKKEAEEKMSELKPFLRANNLWRLIGLVCIAAGQFAHEQLVTFGPVSGSALSIAGIVLALAPILTELASRFRGGPPSPPPMGPGGPPGVHA
jgi:drug/metabolite transporter (DMT)-like permease